MEEANGEGVGERAYLETALALGALLQARDELEGRTARAVDLLVQAQQAGRPVSVVDLIDQIYRPVDSEPHADEAANRDAGVRAEEVADSTQLSAVPPVPENEVNPSLEVDEELQDLVVGFLREERGRVNIARIARAITGERESDKRKFRAIIDRMGRLVETGFMNLRYTGDKGWYEGDVPPPEKVAEPMLPETPPPPPPPTPLPTSEAGEHVEPQPRQSLETMMREALGPPRPPSHGKGKQRGRYRSSSGGSHY